MRYTDNDKNALVTLTDALHEISVLEARLQTLPEREKLDRLNEEHSSEQDRLTRQRAKDREQRTDVLRLRQEVEKLQARERADREALGSETDVEKRRDLRHDLTTTHRRLEDFAERLQRAERTATVFDELLPGVEASERDTAIREAKKALERAENALQADLEAAQSRADKARADMTPDVLEVFEREYDEHGVGAARLKGGTCQGCFMGLDPLTIKELRQAPEDEMQHCPECNVILLFEI